MKVFNFHFIFNLKLAKAGGSTIDARDRNRYCDRFSESAKGRDEAGNLPEDSATEETFDAEREQATRWIHPINDQGQIDYRGHPRPSVIHSNA